MSGERPKVSVLMVTYNHERFIEQAVRSVLNQRVDFAIEFHIGEDRSTDRTREILHRLRDENPGRFDLHERAENLGAAANFADARRRCRGKYTALLEGDDYWTDPLKLRKQVDAMDANPGWAICFHRAEVVHDDGSPTYTIPPDDMPPVSTFDDLILDNFIPTPTVMYRANLVGELPVWHEQLSAGDWPLHLLHASRGEIGFLSETMSAYRVHAGGAWSSRPTLERRIELLRTLARLENYLGPSRKAAFDRAWRPHAERFERELKERDRELDVLRRSLSYRIGRLATWPARIAMDRLRRL